MNYNQFDQSEIIVLSQEILIFSINKFLPWEKKKTAFTIVHKILPIYCPK